MLQDYDDLQLWLQQRLRLLRFDHRQQQHPVRLRHDRVVLDQCAVRDRNSLCTQQRVPNPLLDRAVLVPRRDRTAAPGPLGRGSRSAGLRGRPDVPQDSGRGRVWRPIDSGASAV